MTYDKLMSRMNQLLELGEEVLSTWSGHYDDGVKAEMFYHWKASSLSALQNIFGDNSTHFRGFQQDCRLNWHHEAVIGQGILKAAKEDIEGGYLAKLEAMVAADVFSDFLEMAEHLLDNGFYHPAASLIGAVLEDGLRKIAKNKDISSLNGKLADKQVYNRLVQKQVKLWEDIRNNADHGKFSVYTPEMVKDMVSGVRRFLIDYLK